MNKINVPVLKAHIKSIEIKKYNTKRRYSCSICGIDIYLVIIHKNSKLLKYISNFQNILVQFTKSNEEIKYFPFSGHACSVGAMRTAVVRPLYLAVRSARAYRQQPRAMGPKMRSYPSIKTSLTPTSNSLKPRA